MRVPPTLGLLAAMTVLSASVCLPLPLDCTIPTGATIEKHAHDGNRQGRWEQYRLDGAVIGEREWHGETAQLYHEMIVPVDLATGARVAFMIHRMWDARGKLLSLATEYQEGCTGPSRRWLDDGTTEFLYLHKGRVVNAGEYHSLFGRDRAMPPPNTLDQLQFAPSQPPPPPADKARPIQMSASPLARFSTVATGSTLPFGVMSLTGRMDPAGLAAGTKLSITWRHNGSAAALSTAEATMRDGLAFVDNSIVNTQGPLAPGRYSLEMASGQEIVGRGQIEIEAPPDLAGQTPEQTYLAALGEVQKALTALDGGNVKQAGDLATPALPRLAAVLGAKPDLPDIWPVYQLMRAITALARVEAAVEQKNVTLAVEWAQRSMGHCKVTIGLAQDEQLKTSATALHQAVEQIATAMEQPVG